MGKQNSPRSPPPPCIGKSLDNNQFSVKKCYSVWPQGLKNEGAYVNFSKNIPNSRRQTTLSKHARLVIWTFGLVACFFLMDSLMLSIVHCVNLHNGLSQRKLNVSEDLNKHGKVGYAKEEKISRVMYERLLHMASMALSANHFEHDSPMLWEEPYQKAASAWRPCANKRIKKHQGHAANRTGFIVVSANGGLNQQRVAVCNAVAMASLLNATLVLPTFLYSSVWKDNSQFGDIYQEEYFMKVLRDDVSIVKELPSHLQSLNLEAIGSLVTDMDIMKESKPSDFVEKVLPLLLKNEVVHFLGFGNRLAFDPLPYDMQRLRCKCNFHALKFVPKIQEAGALLVRRIRKYDARSSLLDKQLLGKYMPDIPSRPHNSTRSLSKYIALHLRFEVDMVAYSMCEFGGGENERKQLQAYREIHFPALVTRTKATKLISSTKLRKLGRCPLTPEEAALLLSATGYKRDTYIYLAGSHIYGEESRMLALTYLYPNLVTKENLLTASELAPFKNFSSQLAALDFIACATADVFAMTDSGSQLSSLVTGYRTYYGTGRAPTLRPNKKRFAKILSENSTISWNDFKGRVTKMIEENQRVQVRRVGRSIYRQPRCPECMCKAS